MKWYEMVRYGRVNMRGNGMRRDGVGVVEGVGHGIT